MPVRNCWADHSLQEEPPSLKTGPRQRHVGVPDGQRLGPPHAFPPLSSSASPLGPAELGLGTATRPGTGTWPHPPRPLAPARRHLSGPCQSSCRLGPSWCHDTSACLPHSLPLRMLLPTSPQAQLAPVLREDAMATTLSHCCRAREGGHGRATWGSWPPG